MLKYFNMLDIKFIRENRDLIKDAAKKKGSDFNVDTLLKTDDSRKTLISSVEAKRKEQNDFNDKISSASGEEKEKMIIEMKGLKEKLQKEESKLKKIKQKWQELMLQVPNIPDMSVPEGKNEEDNVELRTWGEKPDFNFKPKSHIDLMTKLGMLDLERGVKVAGFRGYFLRGDGAKLNLAIENFVFDEIMKKGFELFLAPSLVLADNFLATGHFPHGKDEVYKTQDDLYLAGTGEVPMMGFHRDEIFDKKELPKKYVAFSPCFRREAGSYGKDTKGIKRLHEFRKIEQFILCEASHEESVKYHEELTKNAEDILQQLEIPYRVVINSTGDITQGTVKMYDLESWVPSEKVYVETHSSTYYHDFQARRANTKYKDGKLKYVHSLNCTAIATPRILIPLIENNQQKDGSIKVPKVLQKYMGKEIIK
jgi:seryl-tRNA synthetase